MVTGRRPGRPTKPTSERKRNSVTLRVRDALKDAIAAAAKANQRSVSEEAEFRLELSLLDDASVGGGDLRPIAVVMATAFAAGGRRRDGRPPSQWLHDPAAFRSATMKVFETLLALAPREGAPEDFDLAFEARKLSRTMIEEEP